MVCATSQAVNDWYDRHVDAINEPNRPIPSGRIPGRWGLYIADRLDRRCRCWSATVLGPWGFGAAVRRPGPGLGLQRAADPAQAQRLVGQQRRRRLLRGPALVHRRRGDGGRPRRTGASSSWRALYSVGAHGIMTLNDFKSVEGDRRMGIDSLPVLLGVERAARVACLVMAAAAGRGHRPAGRLGPAAARRHRRRSLLVVQLVLMARLLQEPARARALVQRHRHHASTCSACWSARLRRASGRSGGAMTAAPLGWVGIVRLGLVQTALGADRRADDLDPEPGHGGRAGAAGDAARARWWRCTTPCRCSGRAWATAPTAAAARTPWIVGGMAVLAAGGVAGRGGDGAGWRRSLRAGIALAVLAFLLIGARRRRRRHLAAGRCWPSGSTPSGGRRRRPSSG